MEFIRVVDRVHVLYYFVVIIVDGLLEECERRRKLVEVENWKNIDDRAGFAGKLWKNSVSIIVGTVFYNFLNRYY